MRKVPYSFGFGLFRSVGFLLCVCVFEFSLWVFLFFFLVFFLLSLLFLGVEVQTRLLCLHFLLGRTVFLEYIMWLGSLFHEDESNVAFH